MARIRAYYTTLSPEASTYFSAATAATTDAAFEGRGLRRSPLLSIFTLATMVAVVDAVVGGTAVVLLLRALEVGPGLALAGGVGFGAVSLILFFAYQSRRLAALDRNNV